MITRESKKYEPVKASSCCRLPAQQNLCQRCCRNRFNQEAIRTGEHDLDRSYYRPVVRQTCCWLLNGYPEDIRNLTSKLGNIGNSRVCMPQISLEKRCSFIPSGCFGRISRNAEFSNKKTLLDPEHHLFPIRTFAVSWLLEAAQRTKTLTTFFTV
jgi:hypothetical protein